MQGKIDDRNWRCSWLVDEHELRGLRPDQVARLLRWRALDSIESFAACLESEGLISPEARAAAHAMLREELARC